MTSTVKLETQSLESPKRHNRILWTGKRNANGLYVIDLCATHNLFIANTWYQQKKSAQHTWISPDGQTKNQIDFILGDKRYRNGITNCKVMPGADCDSDHNPVVATLRLKLKKITKKKANIKWKTAELNDNKVRKTYQTKLREQLKQEKIDEDEEIEKIWNKLKDCVTEVATEICGKKKPDKKQNWMNTSVLEKIL